MAALSGSHSSEAPGFAGGAVTDEVDPYPQSGSFSPSTSDLIVRLPLDHERSSNSGYRPMVAHCADMKTPDSKNERDRLIAAWVSLLYRYSQQSDINLHYKTEDDGNWRVMYVTALETKTASALAAQWSETIAAHSDATFSTAHTVPNVAVDLTSDGAGSETIDHDLRLVAPPGQTPQLVYNAELLSTGSVERLSNNFGRLYRSLSDNPEKLVEELALLGEQELQLVKRETPRLCRGGSRSLTIPGVS